MGLLFRPAQVPRRSLGVFSVLTIRAGSLTRSWREGQRPIERA